MSNPYKECESCGMEKIPANVNLCAACETAETISEQAQAEIARLKVELESMTLERNTYRDRVEDLKLASKAGLVLAKGSKETEDKLRQENERLRLAMGVEDHETVESSGHGWVRVESPGGDLRRISPIDERVIELEQENERLRKDAERYAYLKSHYHLHVCQGFYREWRYSGKSFDAEPNPKPGEYLTLDAAIDAAKEAE